MKTSIMPSNKVIGRIQSRLYEIADITIPPAHLHPLMPIPENFIALCRVYGRESPRLRNIYPLERPCGLLRRSIASAMKRIRARVTLEISDWGQVNG